jgi:hypothetical protein
MVAMVWTWSPLPGEAGRRTRQRSAPAWASASAHAAPMPVGMGEWVLDSVLKMHTARCAGDEGVLALEGEEIEDGGGWGAL